MIKDGAWFSTYFYFIHIACFTKKWENLGYSYCIMSKNFKIIDYRSRSRCRHRYRYRYTDRNREMRGSYSVITWLHCYNGTIKWVPQKRYMIYDDLTNLKLAQFSDPIMKIWVNLLLTFPRMLMCVSSGNYWVLITLGENQIS